MRFFWLRWYDDYIKFGYGSVVDANVITGFEEPLPDLKAVALYGYEHNVKYEVRNIAGKEYFCSFHDSNYKEKNCTIIDRTWWRSVHRGLSTDHPRLADRRQVRSSIIRWCKQMFFPKLTKFKALHILRQALKIMKMYPGHYLLIQRTHCWWHLRVSCPTWRYHIIRNSHSGRRKTTLKTSGKVN